MHFHLIHFFFRIACKSHQNKQTNKQTTNLSDSDFLHSAGCMWQGFVTPVTPWGVCLVMFLWLGAFRAMETQHTSVAVSQGTFVLFPLWANCVTAAVNILKLHSQHMSQAHFLLSLSPWLGCESNSERMGMFACRLGAGKLARRRLGLAKRLIV